LRLVIISIPCRKLPVITCLITLIAPKSLYTASSNGFAGTPKWRTRTVDEAVRDRPVEVIRIGKTSGGSPEPEKTEDTMIMEILDDQKPHSLSELAAHANIPVSKVRAFVDFLAKYALVTYDKQKQMVVICPDFVLL
jgi:predicted transcriptional regulator